MTVIITELEKGHGELYMVHGNLDITMVDIWLSQEPINGLLVLDSERCKGCREANFRPPKKAALDGSQKSPIFFCKKHMKNKALRVLDT